MYFLSRDVAGNEGLRVRHYFLSAKMNMGQGAVLAPPPTVLVRWMRRSGGPTTLTPWGGGEDRHPRPLLVHLIMGEIHLN